MKRCIRVECWSDNYFFGKLLQGDHLINKQPNKTQVIKGFKDGKLSGVFAVGIVDSDNDAIEPFLKDLTIEHQFFICKDNELEIIKIAAQPHYIIVLHPKEFEKWLVKFVENDCTKTLKEFDYSTYSDFENDAKELQQKILNNEKLMKLFKFVLTEQAKSDNHISKLKSVLTHLLTHPFDADINELKNV